GLGASLDSDGLFGYRPRLERLAGDREQDPDGGEADDQRGAAGADERERDAGDREQRHHDGDVDERLEAQPGGDAGREQGAERVRCAKRRPDPGIREQDEQADDEGGPDEPELLADERGDEVVRGVWQLQPAGELALAETRPEDAAEAEREQALDRVEAGPERVCPR